MTKKVKVGVSTEDFSSTVTGATVAVEDAFVAFKAKVETQKQAKAHYDTLASDADLEASSEAQASADAANAKLADATAILQSAVGAFNSFE